MAAYEQGLEEQMRYNLPMWTSEMLITDNLKRLPGPHTLYPLVTGALKHWGDSLWPTQVVTWSHPTNNWAALTRRTGQRAVDIRFYSFDSENHRFGMKLWNLPAGRYTVALQHTDGIGAYEQTVEYRERAQEVTMEIPPNAEMRITIRPAE